MVISWLFVMCMFLSGVVMPGGARGEFNVRMRWIINWFYLVVGWCLNVCVDGWVLIFKIK